MAARAVAKGKVAKGMRQESESLLRQLVYAHLVQLLNHGSTFVLPVWNLVLEYGLCMAAQLCNTLYR